MAKKKYVKPQIILESFSLSASVSAGCELDTPLPTKADMCGFPTRGGTVFAEGVEGTKCTSGPQGGPYDGFCYDVPTDDKTLFNS